MSTPSSTQPAAAVAASHEPSLARVSGSSCPPPAQRDRLNSSDIRRVVRELELLGLGVPPLVMQEAHEELRTLLESARDRAQPTDVLRRAPPRVVAPAVGVRDEGDRHRAPRKPTGRPLAEQEQREHREHPPAKSGRDVQRRRGGRSWRAEVRVERRERCGVAVRASRGCDRRRRTIGGGRDDRRPVVAMRGRCVAGSREPPAPRLVVAELHDAPGTRRDARRRRRGRRGSRAAPHPARARAPGRSRARVAEQSLAKESDAAGTRGPARPGASARSDAAMGASPASTTPPPLRSKARDGAGVRGGARVERDHHGRVCGVERERRSLRDEDVRPHA